MHEDWIHALEKLHFDIVRKDPFLAHKEYGSHTSVDVQVDESGQVRVAVTRLLENPKAEKRNSRAGREYQVFQDRTHVTLVNYKLREGDDLGVIVEEIEREIIK